MENKTLLIVFVKNNKPGKVKTRLAKTIGNKNALMVYEELLKVTENIVSLVQTDKRIYFSEAIEETQWDNHHKTIQEGNDLGERMKNAFKKGFEDNYNRIILIGSDLPDITENHINKGLEALQQNEIVIGPAEDGGYYLIGLSEMHNFVFENKPWSQSNLLEETLNQIKEKQVTFTILKTLNDIDTYEDLVASKFYQSNTEIQQKTKKLDD